MRQAAVELGDALLGALFLAVEHVAGGGEALQSGSGAGFGLAQRRQLGGAFGLDAGGLGLLAGAFGHLAHGEVMGVRGISVTSVLASSQRRSEQHGFRLAHLGGDLAEADRLPRLLLQAFHLAGELADHVLDAGEVGFGRPQSQFGFVAAGMQAGDPGGIFQHAPALLGLGLDDLADLALVDEGRRARAGRGIREQDLHVAGADVAAVDAIDGTGLALDAAGDFQELAVIDGGRRGAIGVVDRHDHFGVVARRAVAGTGEDHGVHVGGAQRFVRGLAHRPAQRLDQIRLAATVRTNDAGEAGFDHEISRFDERLETMEAKTRQLHKSQNLCWQGANLPAGTIPWKAMSVLRVKSLRAPRVDRDNGFAMASGQPAGQAFPKGFVGVIRENQS